MEPIMDYRLSAVTVLGNDCVTPARRKQRCEQVVAQMHIIRKYHSPAISTPCPSYLYYYYVFSSFSSSSYGSATIASRKGVVTTRREPQTRGQRRDFMPGNSTLRPFANPTLSLREQAVLSIASLKCFLAFGADT